ASMLEVGTGFHPELTGAENVFLNGTIMGMTKKEVKKKFDEIVEFAGVARYIDTPIKRYSSGMSVRLAFSVAAHLDPEILLVDEVLAVGDAEFQQKCLGKMSGISEEGRTIIFVSHNLGSIRKLCNKGLVLSKGHLIFNGDVSTAVDTYLDSLPAHDTQGKNAISFEPDENKLFQFTEIRIEDGYGQSKGKLYYGEDIIVRLKYLINDDCRNFSTRLSVARNGETLFWSFDTDEDDGLFSRRAKGEYSAKIALPRFLKAGIYTISISFIELGIEKESHVDVIRFVLDDSNQDTTIKSWHAERPGILKPRLKWAYTEHPVEV
ncbi:MAG: ABC transporter ATP-binding protein, partial [Saprospiraceae bacterium]